MKTISMILLISSRPSNQSLLVEALSGKTEGYQVVFFEGIQSFLEGFRQEESSVNLELRPCLIVLDWICPDEECIHTLQCLKEDSRIKKIPVLVVAEQSDPRIVRRCYSLNTGFYLLKPSDPQGIQSFLDHMGQFLSLDGVKLPQLRHRWSSLPLSAVSE